jgi:hypothetical protein
LPQQVEGSALASSTNSSISSSISIVGKIDGKIVGQGKLTIFGHVEEEVRASTVQIGDGAQVEGDIVAQELTIGGCVKGTIRANRVKLIAPLWLTAISIIALWPSRECAIRGKVTTTGKQAINGNGQAKGPTDGPDSGQAQDVSKGGNRKINGAPDSANT